MVMRFVLLERCIGIGTASAERGFGGEGVSRPKARYRRVRSRSRWLFDGWRHDV